MAQKEQDGEQNPTFICLYLDFEKQWLCIIIYSSLLVQPLTIFEGHLEAISFQILLVLVSSVKLK